MGLGLAERDDRRVRLGRARLSLSLSTQYAQVLLFPVSMEAVTNGIVIFSPRVTDDGAVEAEYDNNDGQNVPHYCEDRR
jgi:hypothetical protein